MLLKVPREFKSADLNHVVLLPLWINSVLFFLYYITMDMSALKEAIQPIICPLAM